MTRRYGSKLLHLGVGRSHKGTWILMLIENRNVRVVDVDSYEALGSFTLDPTKNYQATDPPPRGLLFGGSSVHETPRHNKCVGGGT